MNTDKITKGAPKIDHDWVHAIQENGAYEPIADVYGEYDEIPHNAELIYESFKIANETGKSPRELQEENEKLRIELAAYKGLEIAEKVEVNPKYLKK